jgi:uncharacterized OB-fold protein
MGRDVRGGERLIEGSECKCGYKTLSKRPECPRCGRVMSPRKFFDEGKVLSFVKLEMPPMRHDKPMNLLMVEIDNGPKVICWADDNYAPEQRVKVFYDKDLLMCKSP